MRNPMMYPENSMPILEGEVVQPSTPRHAVNALLASRSGSLMLQNAMMEAGHDRCRAILTQSALENIGALTFSATQLSQIAPQSSQHYTAILEAYAKQAAAQIERW